MQRFNEVLMLDRLGVVGLVTFAVVAANSPSFAADAAKGADLAQRMCVGCHVVGTTAVGPVQQGPPSFRAVGQSQKSADQLKAFLANPHGVMPNFSLTRTEIDDLIAYVQTLR